MTMSHGYQATPRAKKFVKKVNFRDKCKEMMHATTHFQNMYVPEMEDIELHMSEMQHHASHRHFSEKFGPKKLDQ